MIRKAIVLVFLFFSSYSLAKTIFIIVPGTWAHDHGWHSEDGDFFTALKNTVDQNTTSVITYYWSGKNTHTAREYAAQGLVNLICSFNEYDTIYLVTHSHGSNVAILASQLLAHHPKKRKIETIYAFATPVDPESYFPDMSIIHYFFNFFSYSDFVQTVLCTFQRVYPRHKRIANISVTINHLQPNHDTIHDALIASWLLKIPACFDTFDFQQPGSIAFFSGKRPEYYIELDREERLEHDFYLTQQYCLVLQGRNNAKN